MNDTLHQKIYDVTTGVAAGTVTAAAHPSHAWIPVVVSLLAPFVRDILAGWARSIFPQKTNS